jgi:hypothetical protein
VLIEAGLKVSSVKTLILNQNLNMCHSFQWLYYFPNLNTLTVWYTTITDSSFQQAHRYAPKLNIIEFHQCLNLTGRILLSLNNFHMLQKIIINNEVCSLQENTFETVITEEEWKALKNTTVDTLLIDSGNLTLDFINYILLSFEALTNFIMHPKVLEKLEKNSRSGHSDRKISFHSLNNIEQGFYRYAQVKITDLLKNKIGPVFSDSMLRKIKELDPSKADAADFLMSK